jgi:hypothetical protein
MTREELNSCDGFTVQVSLDGKEELARLLVSESADGPCITWPAVLGPWKAVPPPRLLSDAEIAGLRPNGANNLFSTIRLSTDDARIPG